MMYADDAFSGLHYMERLSSPNGEREVCIREAQVIKEFTKAAAVADAEPATAPSIEIPPAPNIPQPPFWGTRMLGHRISTCATFSSTSTRQRCSRTSGNTKRHPRKTTGGSPRRNKYRPILKELEDEVISSGWFEPKVVYGYFGVQGESNDVIVYHLPEGWKTGRSGSRRSAPI
jgi:5-methyltetrahydrofolate--homocysteine methyltransferase